jgi:hypothetical protein
LTGLDGWQVGDTFLAGSELQRFRILAIDTEAPGVLAGHADAIWIVQPLKPVNRPLGRESLERNQYHNT